MAEHCAMVRTSVSDAAIIAVSIVVGVVIGLAIMRPVLTFLNLWDW